MTTLQIGFNEYNIQAGDVRICVRESGDGPLMLFLHGITANRMVWQPVVDALANDFRTVAVDQRGHGESEAPPTGYTANDYARDVDRLITALGEEDAIVIGHSLGARNALAAACLSPSRIRAVVAIEFTPFIDATIFDALEVRVLGGARDFGSPDEITTYLRRRYERLPDDAISRRTTYGYVQIGDTFRPKAAAHAMAETARYLREDITAAVKQLVTPTLIVRGAESTFVRADAYEATRELRPDLRTLVVPGTDHYVPEEAPEEVADAIRQFLTESPRTRPTRKVDAMEEGAANDDELRSPAR